MSGRAAWMAALLAVLACGALRAGEPRPLRIYFIDVAGGQATLVVSPGGETLLVDAGFAGAGGFNSVPGDPEKARDPGRIRAAMHDAGVRRIDYLVVTHFHRDHIGGIPELTQLVPVGTFIDYGSAYPPAQRARQDTDALDVAAYDAYLVARARGRHQQPAPGDTVLLGDVRATVVSTDRAVLRRPLPGAGQTNTACAAAATPTFADDENPRSTGIVLDYGRFRFLDVGDLVSQPLYDLVCPVDRIGPVDVYLVAHHGNSGAADPATLAAFKPRVAVVNNAPRKGGRRPLLQMLRQAGDVDTWQLHVSAEGGEANAPAQHIANLEESGGHWLKVTAAPDGSFTLTNGRTGLVRAYGPR